MSEVSIEVDKKTEPPILWRGRALNNKAIWRPVKWFIYGLQGSGKTKLACQAPKPILLSADGNGEHIGDLDGFLVTRTVLHKERVKTVKDVIENLEELLLVDHPFNAVIVDTIDCVQDFCLEEVRNGLSDEDVRIPVNSPSDSSLIRTRVPV